MALLRAVLALAGDAALRSLRARVVAVALGVALLLLSATLLAAAAAPGEASRLLVDVGLACCSLLGVVLAVATAVGGTARDLPGRGAYAILARPLPRWAFVVGRALGLWAGVFAAQLAVAGVLYGVLWAAHLPRPAALPAALWLTAVEQAVAVAVSLAASLLAAPAVAAAAAAAWLLAGHAVAEIDALAGRQGAVGAAALRTLAWLLPDLDRLALRSQAANDLVVSAPAVALATAYGLTYAATVLVVAAWALHARRSL